MIGISVIPRIALVIYSVIGMLWSTGVSAADAADARILFINSYHRGYSWSDGIEDGLRERLNASGKKIELSIEYLDSRRFAYGGQVDLLAQAMAVKYANYRPDLVVVSDNAAFDFAIQYRARLFPQQPIVFCGYNNFRPEVIAQISNITGVNEEIAIPDAVALALKVHPKVHTLAFIVSTGDVSSKRIDEIAEKSVFPALRKQFELVVIKNASLEQIRQRLALLPEDTLLFLSGQVTDEGGGRALTPAENGKRITAISPFPAYTFWDFHLNNGAIGGHIITGPEQGHKAAELALRILNGTPADQIPVVMTTPTQDVFDDTVMKRFGITPADLPVGAVVINRPFSFWDNYRWQTIAVIGLFSFETLMISLLLHVARGRRRALRALSKERQLLEQRVQDRTAELKASNARLAMLSTQDGLTGLANRRRFDEVLNAEFLRLHRSAGRLSLIMLDVDHFKDYNDTYGHVAGDACLRQVGEVLAGLVNRVPDLVARYGGEEFCVLLPETNLNGAVLLAERIRVGVEALGIKHGTSPVANHVTVSCGVVAPNAATITAAEELVILADRQLYLAKSHGRNRVVAAS